MPPSNQHPRDASRGGGGGDSGTRLTGSDKVVVCETERLMADLRESRSPAGLLARPLRPYAEVLRIPGAWRFSAAGVIGRMPMSMFGLGTVLLISAGTGKYGVAGLVVGASALRFGLHSPPAAPAGRRRGG